MKKVYAIYIAVCCVAIIAVHALPHAANPESTMSDAFFRSAFNYEAYTLFSNFYPDNLLAKDAPFLLLLLAPVVAVIAVILRRSPLIPSIITALTHLYFVYVIYSSEYVVKQTDLVGPGLTMSLILSLAILAGQVLLLIKTKPRGEKAPVKGEKHMQGKPVKCPKCGKVQPLSDACVACGLDFRKYAAQRKAAQGQRVLVCPKCKTRQPVNPICAKCGYDIRAHYQRQKAASSAGAPPPAAQPPVRRKGRAALVAGIVALACLLIAGAGLGAWWFLKGGGIGAGRAVLVEVEDPPEGGGLTGRAEVVFNGQNKPFEIKTGFFSDTRFSNPKRAEIELAPSPLQEFSNEGIVMIIDATKEGTHIADGKSIQDGFMQSYSNVPVGQDIGGGAAAVLYYKAHGGQIFFPSPECRISITSVYSGTPKSVFSGEVQQCTVHSAGIDYTISEKFTIKGVAKE